MVLLTAEGITKTYGEKKVLNQISFGIFEGDKIGIIGVNGTGKSTLLKIIAGLEQADAGSVVTMSGMRIGYLAQMPEYDADESIFDHVFRGENPEMKCIREYEAALQLLPEDDGTAHRLLELTQQMDKMQCWTLYNEAKTVLTKLGLTDFHKKMGLSSGGERKRAALASALIRPVDLLILDEPTNHIDNETVDFLEKYLQKYTKALIMVTHDRYFLERAANKIFELHAGSLDVFEANYSKYLQMRLERESLEISLERKRQNFLRRELAWIRRGAQARSTKQKARIDRFEEVASKKAPDAAQNVQISAVSSRLGRKTVVMENVEKSFDGRTVIRDFSYIIARDERLGIVGPNGCGKTTLLKIMEGVLAPDKGSVEIGDTVKIGIFGQENAFMDETQTVIAYIKDTAEYIKTEEGLVSAGQMLERFLFPPSAQYAPICRLSGGEKRRLYLLKVLMDSPNVLFLDEPTNDLDIDTLSILEEYLEGFSGAVVTVSHDRYYLDKVVRRIFAFEGDVLTQYEGDYTDYAQNRPQKEADSKADQPKKVQQERPKKEERLKMSYKEQREYDSIGDRIENLEESLSALEKEMEDAVSDYVKLEELQKRKEELQQELEEAMDRWVYLSELAEEIEKNKAERK